MYFTDTHGCLWNKCFKRLGFVSRTFPGIVFSDMEWLINDALTDEVRKFNRE